MNVCVCECVCVCVCVREREFGGKFCVYRSYEFIKHVC